MNLPVAVSVLVSWRTPIFPFLRVGVVTPVTPIPDLLPKEHTNFRQTVGAGSALTRVTMKCNTAISFLLLVACSLDIISATGDRNDDHREASVTTSETGRVRRRLRTFQVDHHANDLQKLESEVGEMPEFRFLQEDAMMMSMCMSM